MATVSGDDEAVTGIEKIKAKLQRFRYEKNGTSSTTVDINEDLVDSDASNQSSKKRKRRQKQEDDKKTVYWEDSSNSQFDFDKMDYSCPGTSKDNDEKCENNDCDDDDEHDAPLNDVHDKFTVSAQSFRKKSSRRRLESSSEDDENKDENNVMEPKEVSNDVHRLSPVNSSESSNQTKEVDEDVDEKETKLQRLREMFPRMDSMELQDALVNSDWCLQAAIDAMLVNSSAANSSDSNSERNDSEHSSNRAASSRHGHSPNGNKRKRLKTGKHRSSTGSRKRHHNKSKKSKDLLDSDSTFSAKEILYDSDDSDIDTEMTPAKQAVLTFLDQATDAELSQVPECSKKKIEYIQALRPFVSWIDLVLKLQHSKGVSTDLLHSAQSLLAAREVVTKLMDRCEQISSKLAESVLRLMSGAEVDDRLTNQPALLNKNLSLTPHQMLGLNWLVLLHKHKVNGILADEMGLGKTIQTIAFLAYLLENGFDGPFAIIVPSSTMDNWQREIRTWAPQINVIAYQGSQQDRSSIRYNILKGTFDKVQVIVSSYQMVIANPEDRALFRRLRFRYAVFDEAHMLKNMTTKRYKHLMGVNASHRLLLTGTPLQNSLVELMSLLTFVVPDMFDGKVQHLTKIFSMESRVDSGHHSIQFERERVTQAKQIMRPFVLRRMKDEVLKTLPKKHHESILCSMTSEQSNHYRDLVHTLREQMLNKSSSKPSKNTSGAMQLRKLANHPLLLRYHYNDRELRKMARDMLQEPTHKDANELLILEDMQVMSDFELHQLCKQYKSIRTYALADEIIASSGKFVALDKLLADIKSKGDRVLIFSQFVMLLDVLEAHVRIRGHNFVRFDGTTATSERQQLIDQFTADKDIFLFLLSTKAGGLGVNLAAANVVILHDIGFNPYDEKQAEDRCHRLGQTKEVTVIHLLSKGTIDEHILKLSEKKLKLERDLTATSNDSMCEESEDVATLLKAALEL